MTARVKMLKTAAGPNGLFSAGKEYDLDDELALAFAEAGAAELITSQAPQIERAVVTPSETAVAQPQRRGAPPRTRSASSPPRAPVPIGE